MRRSIVVVWSLVGVATMVYGGSTARAAEAEQFTAADLEFFEKQVRPVLANHCYQCHGPEKQTAGLRVDSRAALLAGGDSGPAIVPGQPDQGYLVSAVQYGDLYQMPPKGKLPAQHVAALERWVRIGAPWPAEQPPAAAAAAEDFDLHARAQHWAFQPRQRPPLPAVRDTAWPTSPIDRFILAPLEAAGLSPAAPLDKPALLRRLTFDLTGLPPTPAELADFVADDAPDAVDRVVDRLLASPHYGERWARHWLDLVRYAETYGHEFDFDIRNAWRYRDYLIRAFNADLPYDRFVIEHLAGDLLPASRRDRRAGIDQSTAATAFFWFGDQHHSPVDSQQAEADRIDNQIDVLGKTFLGLTISCARCHDHKFDPIRTDDYYALYGILQSSRYRQSAVNRAPRALLRELAQRQRQMNELWLAEGGPDLVAAPSSRAVTRSAGAAPADAQGEQFADFASATFGDWTTTGDAFGNRPTTGDELLIRRDAPTDQPARILLRRLSAGWAHSGSRSTQLQGVLQSPVFDVQQRYVHIWAAGRGARLNLVIDGFTLIRNPIYGGLKRTVNSEQGAWVTFDLGMWLKRRAYIEACDLTTPDPADPTNDSAVAGGYVALRRVVFSNSAQPPADAPPPAFSHEIAIPSDAVAAPAVQTGSTAVRPVAMQVLARPASAELAAAVHEYLEREATIRPAAVVPSLVDGTPVEGRVFIRGSHRTPGKTVPRRFLEVFDGDQPLAIAHGSGRLELAQRLVDPSNPLVARVVVNRLWHYHFGRGLVASTDDFGHMGQPPTHPELLDWLADELVARGWSLKQLHREIVLSSTYRMSSQTSTAAVELDPTNQLWHHVPRRRLEAEAIRDALLAISGRLRSVLYGPSVAPHLTEFMDGRGRPASSGPLDGAGRRSIYLGVRRNFLNPTFLAFDYPIPFTTIGRRTVSHVPAQALVLMNDPLTVDLADRWARRVAALEPDSPDRRIDLMYLMAFARPPQPEERRAARQFIVEQAGAHGLPARHPRVWADLAHTLTNVTEFIFID